MCVHSILTYYLFVCMYTIVKIYNFMTVRICLHICMCVGVCVHTNSAVSMGSYSGRGSGGGGGGGGGVEPNLSKPVTGKSGHQNLPQVDLHNLCVQIPVKSVTCMPLDCTHVGYHHHITCWSPVHDIRQVLHVCYSMDALHLQN